MISKTIIIIDDCEIDLKLLANIVGDIPHSSVRKFQSSKEALQFLSPERNEKVDLILCDFEMPHFNGLETLVAFRKNNKDTPFMFITAYATLERAKACKKEGATGFIVKPYASSKLLTKVEKLLTSYTNQHTPPDLEG